MIFNFWEYLFLFELRNSYATLVTEQEDPSANPALLKCFLLFLGGKSVTTENQFILNFRCQLTREKTLTLDLQLVGALTG